MTIETREKILYKVAKFLGLKNKLANRAAKGWFQNISTVNVLNTIIKNCDTISTIIDVGASDGRWSKDIEPFFTKANYLLIEANLEHEKGLKKYITKNKKAKYEICAAGDTDGPIYFDNSDLFGGVASHEKIKGVEVPCYKVDTLVEKHNLKGKYLLKLDTHGFEVPIFEGAKNTLKNTALIVVETYNFQISSNSLKFWQMCEYMDKLGFAPIGLSEILYREYDNALWQFDLFFVPKTSKVFEYNGYK